MVCIRPAGADDAPFLQQMLVLAADWRSGDPVRPVADVMAEPSLARYVAGWPREGDVGFIAEEERAVGAAWWRYFPRDDPGYGFVDEATPELSIGVVDEARGRGVGTLLLRALVGEARRRALPGLSLSVESDNPAVSLYERLGFVTVSAMGNALTLIRSRL
jgi:ribosomal protein S18 acetylase RimI-like enzyme